MFTITDINKAIA